MLDHLGHISPRQAGSRRKREIFGLPTALEKIRTLLDARFAVRVVAQRKVGMRLPVFKQKVDRLPALHQSDS